MPRFSNRRNMGADGILGLDSLRSQRVLFDFQKQTLTIVPADTHVPEDKDTIVVTARVKNGRLILSQAHAGEHPADARGRHGRADFHRERGAAAEAQPRGQGEAHRPGRASVRHGREDHGRIYDRPRARGRRHHAEEPADRLRRLARVPQARPRRQAGACCSA